MSTIPDVIDKIARDVQHTFEELIMLVLRKTLRPTLNPLGPNTRVIFNTFTGKFERGYIGPAPDDNINKYIYSMTNDCLGWTDNAVTNFRAVPKAVKGNYPFRYPQNTNKSQIATLMRNKVAYSERERQQALLFGRLPPLTEYKNFIEYLTARNMQNLISNRKGGYAYTCNVPYTDSFKQLESVGRDIINQTDPTISQSDSARMSTAKLRVALYNLEIDLANLSVTNKQIYCSFLEMNKIINSVDDSLITWVINLVATLSYQSWDDLTPLQRANYINMLGDDFINDFNSNQLITMLLQTPGQSELILTGSYFYSLLKMLFIVFGYSELTPIVGEGCPQEAQSIRYFRLRKHFQRYYGAGYRRGDVREYSSDIDEASDTRSVSSVASDCSTDSSEFCSPAPCKPACEPVDQCVYNFIIQFGELYPTLVSIMGGTEKFPDECLEVNCNTIPPNYNCLASIPEFLWRFNDFSYCRYLDWVNAKQLGNAMTAKINNKVRYLRGL
jgi:hypothetical protein